MINGWKVVLVSCFFLPVANSCSQGGEARVATNNELQLMLLPFESFVEDEGYADLLRTDTNIHALLFDTKALYGSMCKGHNKRKIEYLVANNRWNFASDLVDSWGHAYRFEIRRCSTGLVLAITSTSVPKGQLANSKLISGDQPEAIRVYVEDDRSQSAIGSSAE